MTIVLNSPETRNAFAREGARALAEALRIADEDPEIRAVVITGNGGNFCSGADMHDIASEAEHYPWAGKSGPLNKRLSKPTIAAIEGYASAEGLGLALLCDIRIVDQTATFGVFARRLGITGDGTAARLPGVVGITQAMDILLTGRAIGSERALAIGLASRKVANGTTRIAAEKLAQEIAAFTPMAIAVDRQTAYAAHEGDVNVAVTGEVRASHEVFATEGLPGVTELLGVERPASRVLAVVGGAAGRAA